MTDFDFFEAFGAVFTSKWRDDAECLGAKEEYFMDPEQYEMGMKYCNTCPVRTECLDDAIYWGDSGLRGGMSDKERDSVILHRRRHTLAFRHTFHEGEV